MRTKDDSVECEFHPTLTRFLMEYVDWYYRNHGDELVVTSGSEWTVRHRRGSMHYQRPAQAADIRTWDAARGRGSVPAPQLQSIDIKALAVGFCEANDMETDCFDIVLETHHIHIELHYKGGET